MSLLPISTTEIWQRSSGAVAVIGVNVIWTGEYVCVGTAVAIQGRLCSVELEVPRFYPGQESTPLVPGEPQDRSARIYRVSDNYV